MQHDFAEDASDFADSALAKLKALGIPANPDNFTVFFTYSADKSPALTAHINKLLKSNEPFTAEHCRNIHAQYFGMGDHGEILTSISGKIESAVNNVIRAVSQAGGDATRLTKELNQISGQLGDSTVARKLRSTIQEILSETQNMLKKTKHLEKRLRSSSYEIAILKQDLEDVRRDATTDSLTGLANRMKFDAALQAMTTIADLEGQALCLVMCDIDHFKRFNDNFGHQIGDIVLKLVSRALTESIKGRDMAARYGGEEFAILLPQTDLQGARIVAQHVRTTISSKPIVMKSTGSKLGTITLSYGVARLHGGESPEDLIKRADEALYLAKRTGRNRVVVADAPRKVGVPQNTAS